MPDDDRQRSVEWCLGSSAGMWEQIKVDNTTDGPITPPFKDGGRASTFRGRV